MTTRLLGDHEHRWESKTVEELNALGIEGLSSSGGEDRTFIWFICHCGGYKAEVAKHV